MRTGDLSLFWFSVFSVSSKGDGRRDETFETFWKKKERTFG